MAEVNRPSTIDSKKTADAILQAQCVAECVEFNEYSSRESTDFHMALTDGFMMASKLDTGNFTVDEVLVSKDTPEFSEFHKDPVRVLGMLAGALAYVKARSEDV